MTNEISNMKALIVAELKAEILSELDPRLHLLRESKVSRQDISKMLFEFGLKMKGIDLGQIPVSGRAGEPARNHPE